MLPASIASPDRSRVRRFYWFDCQASKKLSGHAIRRKHGRPTNHPMVRATLGRAEGTAEPQPVLSRGEWRRGDDGALPILFESRAGQ
jgi:hypothetical protein